MLANADAVYGRDVEGFADLDGCHFSIDISATGDQAGFCDVFVHERLHLVRHDDWHDPAPNSPLYAATTGYPPCHTQPAARTTATTPHWLTRHQVQSLMARRLVTAGASTCRTTAPTTTIWTRSPTPTEGGANACIT